MLADWLNALVAQLLGGYIKRECLEKADYNFWGHYVILKGLELKPEALYDLQLPIRLIRGYIGQITIRLPGLLGRSPVEVSVEQVFLVVATDYRHDGLWQDRYNDNLRCTKLAAADAALARVERKRAELQKHRDGVMAGGAPAAAAADHLDSGDMLPEGWVDAATPAPSMLSGILDKLRAKVLENLQIQVRSLHLRWEDRQSSPSAPFAVGVTMELLRVETTNSDWDPINADQPTGRSSTRRAGGGAAGTAGGPHRILKRLKVKNLAIYCQALPSDSHTPLDINLAEAAQGGRGATGGGGGEGADSERFVTSLFDHEISTCDVKNFARLFQDCIPTRDMLLRPPQGSSAAATVPSPMGSASASFPPTCAPNPPLSLPDTLRPGHALEKDLVLLPVDPEVRLQLSKNVASLSKPQREVNIIVDGVTLSVQMRQYEAVLALAAGFACYDARLRHAHLRPAQALRRLPVRKNDGSAAAIRFVAEEKAAHSRIVRSWWRYAAVASLRDHAATQPSYRARWRDLCDFRVLRKAYVNLHQRSVAASEPPTAWPRARLRAFHRFQSRHHFADADSDRPHGAHRQAARHASRPQGVPLGTAKSSESHVDGGDASSAPRSSTSSQSASDSSDRVPHRAARTMPVISPHDREELASANLVSWSDASLIRPMLHRSLLAYPHLPWARRFKGAWLRAVAAVTSDEDDADAPESEGESIEGATASRPWTEIEVLLSEQLPVVTGGHRAGLNPQEAILLRYLETVLPLPDIILLRLVAQRQLRLDTVTFSAPRPLNVRASLRHSHPRAFGLGAPLGWHHEEGEEEDESSNAEQSYSTSSSDASQEGEAQPRYASVATCIAAPAETLIRVSRTAPETLVHRPTDSDCYDASDDELGQTTVARVSAAGGIQRSLLALTPPVAPTFAASLQRPPSTDMPSRFSVTGAARRRAAVSATTPLAVTGADVQGSPKALSQGQRARRVRARGPVVSRAKKPGLLAVSASRGTTSTASSPPRGGGDVRGSESEPASSSDHRSSGRMSDDGEEIADASVGWKPLSSWFDFSWLWSDRSAAAPASATSAAAPPHSAPSTASTVKTRVSASTGQHARFQHGHTKEPPPPEERERLTLEIQRREFFELIDYDPREALDPYPKSYVHSHFSLQLDSFSFVLAHGENSTPVPILCCQLRGLGLELLQRPTSFRFSMLLADLDVFDTTVAACEEFRCLLRKSPQPAAVMRKSESLGSFADGTRTILGTQNDRGIPQAPNPLIRVIYETFPADSVSASAIAGGLGATLQDTDATVPAVHAHDAAFVAAVRMAVPTVLSPGPLRAVLPDNATATTEHGPESARASVSGAQSRRSRQRRHVRTKGRERPSSAFLGGPSTSEATSSSSNTLFEQSSQLGSVRSKPSQASSRRSRTASSITRSANVRLRRPAWTVNADHALIVHLQPLELVYNAPLFERIVTLFVKPAASLHDVPGGRLVLNSLENELTSVSRGLEAAYAQRLALAVDVRLSHPVIIVPLDVRFSSTRIVVLDLGKLVVASRELRSKADIAAAARRLQGCQGLIGPTTNAVLASPEVSTDAERGLPHLPTANITPVKATTARNSLLDETVGASPSAAAHIGGTLDEMAQFDCFELRITKAQVLLARGGSDWRGNAEELQDRGLALLQDNFSITAVIHASILPDDPALPRMKASVVIPTLSIRLSSAQWASLQDFASILPPSAGAERSRPIGHAHSRGVISALNRDLPAFSGSKLERWLTSLTRVGPLLRITSDSEAAASALGGYTTANSAIPRRFNESALGGYSSATSGPGAPSKRAPSVTFGGHQRDAPASNADKPETSTLPKLRALRSQRTAARQRQSQHDAGREFAMAAVEEMRQAVYGTRTDAAAFGLSVTISSLCVALLESSHADLERRWSGLAPAPSDECVRGGGERPIVFLRSTALSCLYTVRTTNTELHVSIESASIEDARATTLRRMLIEPSSTRRPDLPQSPVVLPPPAMLSARFCRKFVPHASNGSRSGWSGIADQRQILPHIDSAVEVACSGLVLTVNESTISLLLKLFLPPGAAGGVDTGSRCHPNADATTPFSPAEETASQSSHIQSHTEPAPPLGISSYWHTEEVIKLHFQLRSLEVRLFEAEKPLLALSLGESRVRLRSALLLKQQLGLRLLDVARDAAITSGGVPMTPVVCRTPVAYGANASLTRSSSLPAALVLPALRLGDPAAAVIDQGRARRDAGVLLPPNPAPSRTSPILRRSENAQIVPLQCALLLPYANADRGDIDNWHCFTVVSSTPAGSTKASIQIGAVRVAHLHTSKAGDYAAISDDVIGMRVPGERYLVTCDYLDTPLTKLDVAPKAPDLTSVSVGPDDVDDIITGQSDAPSADQSRSSSCESLTAQFPVGLAVTPSLAVGRAELRERDIRSLSDRAVLLRIHVRGVSVTVDAAVFARLAAAVRGSELVSLLADTPASSVLLATSPYAPPARWLAASKVLRFDAHLDSSDFLLHLGVMSLESTARSRLSLKLKSLSLQNAFIDPTTRGLSRRAGCDRSVPASAWAEKLSLSVLGISVTLHSGDFHCAPTPIVLDTDALCELNAPAIFLRSAPHVAPAWTAIDARTELLELVSARVRVSPVRLLVTPKILGAFFAAINTTLSIATLEWIAPSCNSAAEALSMRLPVALSRLRVCIDLSEVRATLAEARVGNIAELDLFGVSIDATLINFAASAISSLESLAATNTEQFSCSIAAFAVHNALPSREVGFGSQILSTNASCSDASVPFLSLTYLRSESSPTPLLHTFRASCERPRIVVTPDVVAALIAFSMCPELLPSIVIGAEGTHASTSTTGIPPPAVALHLNVSIPELWLFEKNDIKTRAALVVSASAIIIDVVDSQQGLSRTVAASETTVSLCSSATDLASRRTKLMQLASIGVEQRDGKKLSVRTGPATMCASLLELASVSDILCNFASTALSDLPPGPGMSFQDDELLISSLELTLVDRHESLVTVPLIRLNVGGLGAVVRESGDLRVFLADSSNSILAVCVRDSSSNSWTPLLSNCNRLEIAVSGLTAGPTVTVSTLQSGSVDRSILVNVTDVAAEVLQRLTAGVLGTPARPAPALFRVQNDTGARLMMRVFSNSSSPAAASHPWTRLDLATGALLSLSSEHLVLLHDAAQPSSESAGLAIELASCDEVAESPSLRDVTVGVAQPLQVARRDFQTLDLPNGGGSVVAESFEDGRGGTVTRLRSKLLLSNLLDVPVRFVAHVQSSEEPVWSTVIESGSGTWVAASVADDVGLRFRFFVELDGQALHGDVDLGAAACSSSSGTASLRVPVFPFGMPASSCQASNARLVVAQIADGRDAVVAAALSGDGGARCMLASTASIGDECFAKDIPPMEPRDPQTAWVRHASSSIPLAECDPHTFQSGRLFRSRRSGDSSLEYGLRVLSLHYPLMVTNLLPTGTELRVRTTPRDCAPADAGGVALLGSPNTEMRRLSLLSGQLFGCCLPTCIVDFRPANMHGWSSGAEIRSVDGGATTPCVASSGYSSILLSPEGVSVSTMALHCVDLAGLATLVHLETTVTSSGCVRCVVYSPYAFQDRSGLGLQLRWRAPRVSLTSMPAEVVRSVAMAVGSAVLAPLYPSRIGGVGSALSAGSRSDRCGGSSVQQELLANDDESPGAASLPLISRDLGPGLEQRDDCALFTACSPMLLLPAVDPSQLLPISAVDRGEWSIELSCARAGYVEHFSPVDVRSLLLSSPRTREDCGHAAVSGAKVVSTGLTEGESCIISVTAGSAVAAAITGEGRRWSALYASSFFDSAALCPVSRSPWSWMLARTVIVRALPRVVLHNASSFPLLIAPRTSPDTNPPAMIVSQGQRAPLSSLRVVGPIAERASLNVLLDRGVLGSYSLSSHLALDSHGDDGFVACLLRSSTGGRSARIPEGVQCLWRWLDSSSQLKGVQKLREASSVESFAPEASLTGPAAAAVSAPPALHVVRTLADELCVYAAAVGARGAGATLFNATDFGCSSTVLTVCGLHDQQDEDRADHESIACGSVRSVDVTSVSSRSLRASHRVSTAVLVDALFAMPFRVCNRTGHALVLTQLDEASEQQPLVPGPCGLLLAPHSMSDFCWPEPTAPAPRRRLRCWIAVDGERQQFEHIGLLDPTAEGCRVVKASFGGDLVCADVRLVAATAPDDASGDKESSGSRGVQHELGFYAEPAVPAGTPVRKRSPALLPSPPRLLQVHATFSLRVSLGLRAWTRGGSGRRLQSSFVPVAALDLVGISARLWSMQQASSSDGAPDPWGASLSIEALRLHDVREGALLPRAFEPLALGAPMGLASSAPHVDFAVNSVLSRNSPFVGPPAVSEAEAEPLTGAARGADSLSLDVSLSIAPTAVSLDEHFMLELSHAIAAVLAYATPNGGERGGSTGGSGLGSAAPTRQGMRQGADAPPLLSTPRAHASPLPLYAADDVETVGLASPPPSRSSLRSPLRGSSAQQTPRGRREALSELELQAMRRRLAAARASAALGRSPQLSRLGTPLQSSHRAPSAPLHVRALLVPAGPPLAPFSAHVAALRVGPLHVSVRIADEVALLASPASAALSARCSPVPLSRQLAPWLRETQGWLRWAAQRCGSPLTLRLSGDELAEPRFLAHDPYLGEAFAALFLQRVAEPLRALGLIRSNTPLLWRALAHALAATKEGGGAS